MLPKGLLKEYWRTLSLLIRLLDMTVVFGAGFITYYFKFNSWDVSPEYFLGLLIGAAATPVVFSFFSIYTSVRGQGLISHFLKLIQALVVLMLLLAGLSFFTKTGEIYSRVWFSLWMASALVVLISYRCALLLFLRFMRAHGMNERVVVIFGAGKLGVRFASTVQQALWTGFRIIYFLDDHAGCKPEKLCKIPVLQTPEDLGNFLKLKHVDEIWLALPLRAEARVKEILYSLRHETITTRFVLDIFDLDLINHSISDVAGFPVLNISTTPMMGANRLVKAIEDRIISAFIVLAISPLLCLIALGVKFSSRGPVLFKQQRLGWDGRIINVYKFRTMYVHAEENGKVTQAKQYDARITPFGRFLRRTSLDELPQFINVLQGRMSIVGPRPHALAHNEQYKDVIHTYMQRHYVKPGITGWAQINGWRGETDTLEKMQKRVEYDLYYINNWSLGFDFKIIFLTFLRGFIGRNAY
ncbi:MAG TPA: undecaprenyl-phosphate glucose phosphotransferase [Gammaproteobacteria bacterium]|nr:undecaprenyl-phosphate glucose phosphotransferase [Gammaproteobacteria bacterium]